MELLNWFGGYSGAFSFPFAATLAAMIIVMLTSGLLGFASGNGQTALLRTGFLAMAFLFIAFYILAYLAISGGAEVDFQSVIQTLFRIAALLVAFGLFAALTSWILRQLLGDATGLLRSAMSLLWRILGVVVLAWLVLTMLSGNTEGRGIVVSVLARFWPVWVALVVTYALSITFKRRLGLYGKLFDSPVGMTGFGIVMFWVFTAIFADQIITHDPFMQTSGLKNALPGSLVKDAAEGVYSHYLLGGDHLARDVFSRMVMGARSVLSIAPAATAFAFMVGVTLGLPAGYFGGKFDTILSFIANLVLAFPVILLFYLLVTPEIAKTRFHLLDPLIPGNAAEACAPLEAWSYAHPFCQTIPETMAALLFVFPIIFLVILWNSRYFTQPARRNLYVAVTLVIGVWLYFGLAFDADPTGVVSMPGNILIVFVSVVFVNSPTVFRILRGLVMDLKARDYVAAAQTRGEGPWYIMLWEILPNARGPLIVDFCLRIGYTTILLGTLGFFGLGVSPDSPDWGSTIDDGRKLLSLFPHPAVVPALSLMSLVLGLNLLADGLREESLKD